VNIQFNELNVHSQMNARTMTLYAMSNLPEVNSALHSQFLDCDDETDGTNDPDLVGQAEKGHSQISSTI
jgi:hypothetical protein